MKNRNNVYQDQCLKPLITLPAGAYHIPSHRKGNCMNVCCAAPQSVNSTINELPLFQIFKTYSKRGAFHHMECRSTRVRCFQYGTFQDSFLVDVHWVHPNLAPNRWSTGRQAGRMTPTQNDFHPQDHFLRTRYAKYRCWRWSRLQDL